jgi:hypothetical protein
MPVLPLALPSSRRQRSFSEPVIESQRGLPRVAPAAPVAEPLADGVEVLPLLLLPMPPLAEPLAPAPEVDGVDGVMTLPLVPAPAEPDADGVDGVTTLPLVVPLAPAPAPRGAAKQRSFSAPINVSQLALLEVLPLAPALPLTPVDGLPLGCAAVLPDVDAPALPCPEVWA